MANRARKTNRNSPHPPVAAAGVSATVKFGGFVFARMGRSVCYEVNVLKEGRVWYEIVARLGYQPRIGDPAIAKAAQLEATKAWEKLVAMKNAGPKQSKAKEVKNV